MTRVLILYGSTDGHTREIALAVARALQHGGLQADVVQAGAFEPVIDHYSAVIVAASVHAGKYQPAVVAWVKRHASELNERPSALVSVSLAVLRTSDPQASAELDAIVSRFTGATGWQPGIVKQVAGALRYTRYNFIKRWIMKRMVARAGGDTDTSRDYTYTDWADLGWFAEDFSRRLTAAA